MLEFRQLGESSIKVFLPNEMPEKRAGSIADQCCYTLFYLDKIPHPIKIKYEVGKGGYLSKKSDGVYIYRDKMIEIFEYLYQSEALRIFLRKRIIELNRTHIEGDTYLTVLQRYEKEIKL